MAEQSKFFESTIDKRNVLLQRNFEYENKLTETQTSAFKNNLDKRVDAVRKTEEKIRLLRKNGRKSEADALKSQLKKEINDRLAAEEAYERQLLIMKQTAKKTAEIYEQNRFKQMNAAQRQEYHKHSAELLAEERRTLESGITAKQQQLEEIDKLIRSKKTSLEDKKKLQDDKKILKAAISEESTRLTDIQGKEDEELTKATKFSKAALIFNSQGEQDKKAVALEQITQKANEKKASKQVALSKAEEDLEKSRRYWNNRIEKARKAGNTAEVARLEAQRDNSKILRAKQDAVDAAQNDLKDAELEAAEALKNEQKNAVKGMALKGAMNFVNKTADNITENLQALYGQQGRMMGRLQGSDTKWNESVFDVTTTVGVSGIVSQKNVIAKMVELVDSGVAYNLEMRAFLAETSENIASTFDAANGTLLRLIRLQQSDTTAARLGMEATLTKLFNKFFEDTSYLTDSGPADTVVSAILDASATMGKNKSLEFEFTVQKWLGSLYSLGMSSDAVQTIAEGINYLGTGNVSALSGNTALQTLFAMSASKAGGKSYAEMLTTGLTSEDTNKLLRAMIEYLADIANSQTNYVTKAAYADLFNMSITDLSTFSSLTSQEISNLYNQTISYNELMKETKSQLLQTITRVSVAELVDTAIENAEVGAASLMGSNPVTYGMWKALALLKDYVGEVKIPGVIGFGTGIASGLDLLNLAQTAMAGMGLIGSLVGGLGSMMTGGVLNFNKWNYEEYTSRGGGLSILDTGSLQTTSYSASVGVGGGGGVGEAVSDVSLESGKEQGMEAAGITSEEMEEQQEIPQKIYDALAGESSPNVLSLLEGVNARLDILNSLQGVTYDPETDITNIVENESSPNVLSLLEGVNDDSILGVLQEINSRIDPSRVFYTAIVDSLSSDAAAQVMMLSSQIATAKATSSLDEESTKPISSSNGTNASTGGLAGAGKSSEEETSLEGIIASAVEQAIRNIAGYSSGTGLPVTVTNLTNGGVM